MQLLFIRKEIEGKVVRDSNLLKDAVQVAVSNCLGKRKSNLWVRKAGEFDGSVVSVEEMEAIQARMEKDAPWTPGQKGGGSHG